MGWVVWCRKVCLALQNRRLMEMQLEHLDNQQRRRLYLHTDQRVAWDRLMKAYEKGRLAAELVRLALSR